MNLIQKEKNAIYTLLITNSKFKGRGEPQSNDQAKPLEGVHTHEMRNSMSKKEMQKG